MIDLTIAFTGVCPMTQPSRLYLAWCPLRETPADPTIVESEPASTGRRHFLGTIPQHSFCGFSAGSSLLIDPASLG